MTPQDDDVAPEDQPRAMWRFPVWKRTIVMSAGSVTHFILAIVAMWFAAVFVGLPNPALPANAAEQRTVPADDRGRRVRPGQDLDAAPCAVGQNGDVAGPAAAAGLKDGDLITAVGGTPVAQLRPAHRRDPGAEAGAGGVRVQP